MSGVGPTEPHGAAATKYDELAERFTEHEYGDPERYFVRRAEIVVSLGPRLEPGDTVLDLACADGSAAPPLLERGLRYSGVDASPAMLEVARRRHPAAQFEQGDLLAYTPPEPVATTTIFRSLHFVDDPVAFFRHIAQFTEKKLVFDFAPRRRSLDDLREDARRAGFTRLATRPFFVPQHGRLPASALALLRAAETAPPIAGLILRFRFSLICAASRG